MHEKGKMLNSNNLDYYYFFKEIGNWKKASCFSWDSTFTGSCLMFFLSEVDFSVILVPLPCHMEKEMSTHSSVLAWTIPRTEEPGGAQSMGL